MRNGIWLLLGAVILMCALATLAAAQGTADMVGRVADSSGGILPGVTVTARHLATNLTRTTVTSETGDYTFTALPVGEYEVKTELSGFRTETSRVNLATGDRARADFRLDVGAGRKFWFHNVWQYFEYGKCTSAANAIRGQI